MRITNSIMQRNSLAQLQSGLSQVAKAQQKVSSGLRMQRASDDPSAATPAMHTRSELRALSQYRRNIDQAEMRASVEEGVLDQLGDVLIRAKELGLAGASDTSDASARETIRVEVDALIQHTLQLGNTRFGEEYLFGGARVDEPPFDATQAPPFLSLNGDGTTRTPEGVPSTEIGAQRYLQVTHDGKEVFLDTRALEALQELSDALGAADPQPAIQASLTKLDEAFGGVQNLLGDIGGRTSQLEVTRANLDALEINLTTLKSELEDVDIEEAITELMGRQTAFQAAMLATSRVMGLTLADYLR